MYFSSSSARFCFHGASDSMKGSAFIPVLLQSRICGQSLQNKYQM